MRCNFQELAGLSALPFSGMIGKETFAACKPGLRIINCARGGIVDNEALLAALEDGQCGGAALDVFENEPPTGVEQTIVQHPKVPTKSDVLSSTYRTHDFLTFAFH